MSATTAAIALGAVLVLAAPASAAIQSGSTSCNSYMSAKITANTGAGTTTFWWGEGSLTHYAQWANWSAGTKVKSTGMNPIDWAVTAPSISSASGSCYYS